MVNDLILKTLIYNTLNGFASLFESWLMHYMIESVKSLSRVWLFATPWIVACQAPLSMEFSRPEHWSA